MSKEVYGMHNGIFKEYTNNGKSYEIETGGYENEEGEIVHKAVGGVIDTGIDPSHRIYRRIFLVEGIWSQREWM